MIHQGAVARAQLGRQVASAPGPSDEASWYGEEPDALQVRSQQAILVNHPG
jgi:hypothetical protein